MLTTESYLNLQESSTLPFTFTEQTKVSAVQKWYHPIQLCKWLWFWWQHGLFHWHSSKDIWSWYGTWEKKKHLLYCMFSSWMSFIFWGIFSCWETPCFPSKSQRDKLNTQTAWIELQRSGFGYVRRDVEVGKQLVNHLQEAQTWFYLSTNLSMLDFVSLISLQLQTQPGTNRVLL